MNKIRNGIIAAIHIIFWIDVNLQLYDKCIHECRCQPQSAQLNSKIDAGTAYNRIIIQL